MGYCTLEDIKADWKGVQFLPYDSNPGAKNSATTVEQLEKWIDDESNYIDGIICKVYQLPIDPLSFPQAASILRKICIYRVSMLIKNKNELKQEITQKNSDEKFAQNYVRTPNDDLMAIAKKNLILIGVPEVDATGGFDSFASDSGSDCCRTPKFNTCKQQW